MFWGWTSAAYFSLMLPISASATCSLGDFLLLLLFLTETLLSDAHCLFEAFTLPVSSCTSIGTCLLTNKVRFGFLFSHIWR
jgi:hypothetical protein